MTQSHRTERCRPSSCIHAWPRLLWNPFPRAYTPSELSFLAFVFVWNWSNCVGILKARSTTSFRVFSLSREIPFARQCLVPEQIVRKSFVERNGTVETRAKICEWAHGRNNYTLNDSSMETSKYVRHSLEIWFFFYFFSYHIATIHSWWCVIDTLLVH